MKTIVRSNRDPALLEWLGTGHVPDERLSDPAGAERTVTLRYSQLCRKSHGLTDFIFPLSTAKYTSQPVEKLRHPPGRRQRKRRSRMSIAPPTRSKSTAPETDACGRHVRRRPDVVPSEDFRLLYDVGRRAVSAPACSAIDPTADEDGYFLLLASPRDRSPTIAERAAKTVVFVVDRSGSMSGEKIEQAKGALKFVLNNLREGDLFNIVAYDSESKASGRNCSGRATKRARPRSASSKASTPAAAPISTARSSRGLDNAQRQQPAQLRHLSDRRPADRRRNGTKRQIVNNAKQGNHVRARLFAFGVGYDVNSRLLDKLARANHGAERICAARRGHRSRGEQALSTGSARR